MNRRRVLAITGAVAGPWPGPTAGFAANGGERALVWSPPDPRIVATFSVGQAATVELAPHLTGFDAATMRLRLRADLPADGLRPAPVDAGSQFPEFKLEGTRLSFDGSGAGSRHRGASAARVQIEVGITRADRGTAMTLADRALIRVEAGTSTIRHGLDRWPSFDALSRAVQGNAAPGTTPKGRTDLIGQTFEVTPGMLSEPLPPPGDERGTPVAKIQFPCTVKAADAQHPPVFRSLSGRRDVIQIEASLLPPIDGEVCLQDLVVRDNRAWYDSGEAGVRIKDRFAGRSVRLLRCEFVRCQNAVSGGTWGQVLRIHDCRIVDCGFGTQAHGLYVSPGLLEFFGNRVTLSAGDRLARAHLLKTRAARAVIHGNHFSLPGSGASFMIDSANGGDVELAGNEFHQGPLSDNRTATLVSYAAEGPPTASCAGCHAPPVHRLVVRNNTFVSTFAGPTRFIVIDEHRLAPPAVGSTWPSPLAVMDNRFGALQSGLWVSRRERIAGRWAASDLSARFAGNTDLATAPGGAAGNTGGPFSARRFRPAGTLDTGSVEHEFVRPGA